ncbi:MAG: hypothetical protein K9W42_06925 [Candidatus Heimdallarchaeota archaeon]|nr:hypothetical protein [Candidatus Heimdallarchaeota archaeon]
MVKLEKIGFIAALVGGLLGVVVGILSFTPLTTFAAWYLGGNGLLGWLVGSASIVWPILLLVFSALALIIGILKAFFEVLEFNLLLWGILLVLLGALMWGIPGWLVLLGGIFVIIGKFME